MMYLNKKNILFNLVILVYLLDILFIFYPNKFIQYSQNIILLILLFRNIITGAKTKSILFILLLSSFLFYIIYGFFLNNDLKYLGMDIISFSPIFFIYYLDSEYQSKLFIQKLIRFFTNFLPFAIIISLYILMTAKIKPGIDGERLDISSSIEDLFNWSGVTLVLLPVLILAPFADYLKKKSLIIWFFGVFLFLAYGLFVVTREYVIVAVGSFLIGLYSINKKIRIKIFSYSLITLIISFFFIINLYGSDIFYGNIFSNLERFTSSDDFSSGRDLEMKALFNSYNTIEWFFGRGYGGFNKDYILSIDGPVAFAHFGWVYLILKGGLTYMVFITLTLIYSLFLSFNNNKKLFYFILLFIIQDFVMHSQWVYYTRTMFTWIIISIVFINIKKLSN